MARPRRLPRFYGAHPTGRQTQSPKVVVPRNRPRASPPLAYHQHRQWSRDGESSGWRDSSFKLLEASVTAFGSVVILGLAGYSYHVYYKSLVLAKMEGAFAVGYSSLEKAALSRHDVNSEHVDEEWIPREEQAKIDEIIDGTCQGHYWLLTGEKGTGKTSMLLHSIKKIHGEGIAMLEVHGDLEIFRLRLGKALDYEFHEDYIGSLFSFKGPRDTTPLLDIERAFNQMEKIALKRKKKLGRPLVLLLNGVHLLRDNEDGRNLLELVQQRAELWAASKLVTVVLNSNDYWITERLTHEATRLRVMPVHDLSKHDAIACMKKVRERLFFEDVSTSILEHVYSRIGGRLRFLNQVANSPDMVEACDTICEQEKRWFLNQCWILGEEMDPAGEEQQDTCTGAMILARELVRKQQAMQTDGITSNGLPQIPLHEARQIMTKYDWIQRHDHFNIFAIDSNSMVQAGSVAMQNAFKDVCNQEGFDAYLQETLDRLDQLESLGRTREITFKDFQNEGEYRAVIEGGKKDSMAVIVSLKAVPKKGDD
ncbi:hypothetical protein BGZ61DRAFT_415659 [Ilyonectria robusta]|uniref:uncharacterized protein n=1 Tax=Ilyonectria robusta TaxID=1079257 RepID=UPI001E8CD298|nr:uncharacterized protein BGZ61DRAFT_415659 [Ilyonectria robusta]KAH8729792.1 hypothetical protein BGZ61DRAFT_415659 [Ilyonectria robusta]